MERTVLLLRGINVGANNRVSMPDLRERLAAAGLGAVRTHLQSGNVIVDGDAGSASEQLKQTLRDDFGVEVPVVARTCAELADVVAANPLERVATDPKLYQVTFLSAALESERVEAIAARATDSEEFAERGRELYGWHPGGIHNSKLAAAMGAKSVLGGRTATARNWTTVTKLLEMCDA